MHAFVPLVPVQRALVRTVEMKDYHPAGKSNYALMTVPSVSSGITRTPLPLMLSMMRVVGVNVVPVDAPEEGAGVAEEGVGAAEAGLDMGVAEVREGVAEVQGRVAKGTGEQHRLLMTIPGIPKCCSKIQIIKLCNGHMYKCKGNDTHRHTYITIFLLTTPLFSADAGGPTWQSSAQVVTLQSFTEEVGPAVSITPSILGTFRLFFTVALMSTVVEQTNLYARQVLGDNGVGNWTDVTESDILAFLGFAILMGINQLPSLADYWKKDPYFHYSPIADRITRDRFLQIWRFLHFVDNSTLLNRSDPEYDRLCRIRPVVDSVLEACKSNYRPHRHQSIDEAMIAFKGRNSMKQYMPKKPTKRGFKVWVRADATNGYVSQFELYTGKQGSNVEVGLGGNVVTRLTRDLVGKFYHVFMDNFFSSVALFRRLLADNIYATGTLRSNRKMFPADLVSSVKRGLPSRGDIEFQQDGNLVIFV